MVTYAYLRVSTNQQDVDNQRHGIFEYANKNSLGHLEFISDSVSGQKRWRDRELGQLLTQTAIAGDLIVFAEISRMARSTLQVLEILECCMQRELTVHIAKQQMVLDDNLPSRITATVLGLAAEIERELISMRTKEALAKRKASGKSLGRPKGRQSAKLKLDPRKQEIQMYLDKGISKRSIAKLVDCAPSTLYYWLERNQLFKSKSHH
ncbi:MAG: recombinase family protein [Cyanobacteria bacterium P01_A01_bin.40]